MSFTRFHDDLCRINKRLQESTDIGRYVLNVPGNGTLPLFYSDPHIRAQKWGGNLRTNHINLDSDLKGMTRSHNRDDIQHNDYNINAVYSSSIDTPTTNAVLTDQSRTTHPAWTFRDISQHKSAILPLNPQFSVSRNFQNNLNTRTISRDNFIPSAPRLID